MVIKTRASLGIAVFLAALTKAIVPAFAGDLTLTINAGATVREDLSPKGDLAPSAGLAPTESLSPAEDQTAAGSLRPREEIVPDRDVAPAPDITVETASPQPAVDLAVSRGLDTATFATGVSDDDGEDPHLELKGLDPAAGMVQGQALSAAVKHVRQPAMPTPQLNTPRPTADTRYFTCRICRLSVKQ